MFSVVFLLICTFTSTICDESQEIIIEYVTEITDVTTLVCKDKHFVLRDEMVTKMILTPNKTIWKHKCSCDGNSWNVGSFVQNNDEYAAPVNQLFDNSNSNSCNCKFYLYKNNNIIQPQVQLEDGNYTELNCNFEIFMKRWWKGLKVAINSELKQSKPVFHSKEVDVSYTYEFVEDELINVKCKKPPRYGIFYFVYEGNNLNYTSVKKPRNEISFDVVLRAKDMSHVDCIFSRNRYNITLRIYFSLKRHPVEAVRVNGIAIRTNILDYHNYEGDETSVLCPGADTPAKLNYTDQYNILVTKCSVEGETKNVTIYNSDPPNGLRIIGLSSKNLVFKTSIMNWSKIYYEYADGEVVQIKGPYDSSFVCDRNDTFENGTYKLQMKRNLQMTNITCYIEGSESHNTTITFMVSDKKDAHSDNTETGDDKGNFKDGNTVDDNDNSVSNSEHEVPNSGSQIKVFKEHIFEIGVALCVVIILLMMTSIICVLRKRRKPTAKGVQSDVDYVNLNNKKEPFSKNLKPEVYLKPEEASDYAVPVDNSIDTDLYSVPYKTKPNEELYSKPVPKSQRGLVNGEEVKYAAIAFKNPPHTYSNINKGDKECAYAEIHVKPEDLYAKVQSRAERGVGGGPENSTTGEYAEPSYCEVGAMRK